MFDMFKVCKKNPKIEVMASINNNKIYKAIFRLSEIIFLPGYEYKKPWHPMRYPGSPPMAVTGRHCWGDAAGVQSCHTIHQ
jgi:hypothetical protein